MKTIKRILPIGFLFVLSVCLIYKYFFFGKVPIPGDILLGHYHPWIDLRWGGIETIYPVKNWILFDGIEQTLPWRLLAIDEFKKGKLPLWNPYSFSGTPLLANWQTAALYPLNLLFFILPKLDAWVIYLFFQSFLASIFAFLFIKDLTKKIFPSLLSGIGWGFSLIMLNHFEFGIDGHTILWLPLSLLAVNQVAKEFKLRWGLTLLGSVVAISLGGYPPLMAYSFLIIDLYTLLKVKPLFSKKMLSTAFFVFLGISLAALQILPSYKLNQKLIRHEEIFGEESNEAFFLPVENLIMVFAPDFFGHPATWNFSSKVYYSDNAGVGAVAFVFWSISLLLIFFKKLDKRRKKEIVFWWSVVLISTLAMVDSFLGSLLRKIPISFLADITPMRMIWIVAFSFSTLAGLSLSSLDDFIRQKKIKVTPLLFWPVVLILGFGFLSFLIVPGGQKRLIAQRNLILPTFVSLTTVFLVFLSKRIPKVWFPAQMLILCLAGGELLRQGWKYNTFISPDLVFPKTETINYLQRQEPWAKVMITNAELFPVNSNVAYKVPVIGGYASMRDSRYDYLVRLFDGEKVLGNLLPYPRMIYQPRWDSQVASLLGAKYVIYLDKKEDQRLKFLMNEGGTYLYENTSVFDKAFFVEKYSVENSINEIAAKMISVDLAKETVLEKEINWLPNNPELGDVQVKFYEPGNISLEATNKNDGLLVLSEAYDKGWQARIDGVETEVLRANLNLMAVLVPPGGHSIRFHYNPVEVKIGLLISFGSAVVIVALIFYHLPKKIRLF